MKKHLVIIRKNKYLFASKPCVCIPLYNATLIHKLASTIFLNWILISTLNTVQPNECAAGQHLMLEMSCYNISLRFTRKPGSKYILRKANIKLLLSFLSFE